ncbi:TIGR01841 family phasin [Aminobacter sp. NyZ550]|jgi:phasin family protein|uniref:Phasin family protein n=2 Tax=Aminobacter TaxID=31988 RepID=A0AAC8YP81_AMIAI|nr:MULTISPECIES: TIGR01841 family phasin [Aminobacter]AMS42020.1 phasin family protein [Aminobacter aminovorans]MBA8904961.1 phasin family protein [Aminobacter ciceronei]MBA9018485.1 phasin family protein [Aminobacter ciceronei]MBB3706740.1 phasin family protein [Aminobacter aminovorans]MRX31608.1 TIGR01841 family phasin [Aminobacter sp. MDW-2]
MAKKPEPESFMDMFSKFGRDLKMPAVDVDTIIGHHRKNLEALEQSVKATASGASSLVAKQREMLQEALHEITEAAQGLRAPGNPQELISRQADFAKRSFEAAVKNAGEVASIVRKSGTESVDILRSRIHESIEEIRDSFDKKK